MTPTDATPRRSPETRDHHQRAVARVIRKMRARLDEELSLQRMARVAYMSPFHLNRVFRQVTGVPPRRFLTAIRLERAKRLLLTSDLSVTDISLEVGYNSLGTFIRRFGELVGVAPGRFRHAAGHAERTLRSAAGAFAARTGAGPTVEGRVAPPAAFSGPVFVGLFAADLPQSRPVACALLSAGGGFRLGPVPDGRYRAFAAGLPDGRPPESLLLYESALRGGAGRTVRVRGGRVREPLDIELRPPELFDPPILLTFPVLLAERRRRPVAMPPWSDAARQPAPAH